MTDTKAEREKSPSSLNGGKILSLLAVTLLGAISVDMILSDYVYRADREIAARHEVLARDAEQIDRIAGALGQLLETVRIASTDQREILLNVAAVNSAAASLGFLQDLSSELPDETAQVEQAATGLQRSPGSEAVPAMVRDGSLVETAAQMESSLRGLRSGVERTDQANLGRLAEYQQLRIWKNVCAAIAWLLNILAFGYAIQLYRRLRKEEQARRTIQSELAAERTALERRVQARTAALEAEVKERQRAERLNRGRNRTLEMLARSESTANILHALATTVAEYRSTWLCVIHAVEGNALKLVASSGLNDKLLNHFRSISTVFSGAPESMALSAGQAQVILDLGAERKPWSELLRANGLLSVWSAPFFAPKAAALGTLTVYTLLRWEPTTADLEMLEMASNMAALVLERSQLQAQLIDHAYHDSLTGLPNRRLARDRIVEAIKRAARTGQGLSVLWIDLDRFKQINDQYGHPAGDAVLQQTAQRLCARLRASDTLARMGGDEFMVLLEGTSTREAAETTAADLLKVLSAPMQVDELELTIGASIGVAVYPEDGDTGESLAQHADQAMYSAKFNSRGVCSFSSELEREPAQRRELEAELNHALESGGFTIAYQPLCLPDGELEGFEALLRFESPRLGNVPPCDFIPLAEETQLIVPLGEWVLREVCRQGHEWRGNGHPMVPIAVNISALQFVRDDFADMVAGILEENEYPPHMLVLELTESIVMHNFAESARQMERLKRLGVRIAIDDFGTGYSSLSYLHRLPIDVLKIDRSFMENLNETEGTGPIVEAVLSMAHTLGLGVVAEGVETNDQLSTLSKRGCDVIQGFLFSRPVAPLDAAGFLRQGRVDRGMGTGSSIPPGENPSLLNAS